MEGDAAAPARRKNPAVIGAAVALGLLGLVLFGTVFSVVAFAGVAVLGWGRALAMVGLFAMATSLAVHLTREPAAVEDDLTPVIGPAGDAPLPLSPAPPAGGS
jgi:hypothetical protein